jgi:hypothetical protein
VSKVFEWHHHRWSNHWKVAHSTIAWADGKDSRRKVQEFVQSDHHWTVQTIPDKIRILFGSLQSEVALHLSTHTTKNADVVGTLLPGAMKFGRIA